MTFHDPASIQKITDCVDTRGRNQKKQQTEMFSKIIIIFILFYTQSICHGISTTEDYTNVPTLLNIESVTEEVLSIKQENNVKINDIEIPTNESSSIAFIETPKNITTTFGSPVSLQCTTLQSISDCQWSWRPFPPINTPLINSDSISNNSSDNNSNNNSTFLPFLSIQSLPISRFPPYGKDNNNCTLKFDHIKYKQVGYWTCSVRKTSNDSFVDTEPAILSIATEKTELLIAFEDMEDTKETSAGSSTNILCRTKVSVEECQWSWRLFNQTESSDVEIKKFPAFGSNKTDCSIQLKNFLPDQEGLWTCGARIDENTSFVKSKPIRFFVSEVEFVQLSKGIQIPAGKSALLKCLVNKPVVQCEWSWKPLNSSKEPTVIKNFEPNNDNKHECTVQFKSVLYKEEGFWTCGIRLTKSGQLHEAPPAILRLLPSKNSRFLETPKNSSVVVSTQETLKCIATDHVEKCNWLWHSFTEDSKVTVVREFPPIDTFRRNCSLNFPQVRIEDQGYWACQITLASSNTVFTSPFIKFNIYNQDQVGFSEIIQDIQVLSDRKVYLKCVATVKVEKCRWSLTPKNSNTTVVVKQFLPNKGKDCSVYLSFARAEQEGTWTCGIKIQGRETYIEAPSAKLSLLETGTDL